MLLNAVILLLEETLEAALLISMLLAMTNNIMASKRWLPYSLLAGLLSAYGYSTYMADMSEWFNYTGQEVMNALLQSLIALCLFVFTWQLFPLTIGRRVNVIMFCCASAVILSICREGAEIFLYLQGFVPASENYQSVMMGGSLGFGIGVSVGILLYYGLINLSVRFQRPVHMAMLAIFSGNMLSQSALQLIQADWLPAAQPYWDSSAWVSETSITGHLLYSLVGYEATPTLLQLSAYLLGVIAILLLTFLRRHV